MNQRKVSFLVEAEGGRGIQADAQDGETVVQVAYRAGVIIQQTCGGVPSCTDCKVVVKRGIENGFEAPQGPELRLLGNVFFITHERLACQATVKGDSCVFVPTPVKRKEKLRQTKKHFAKNANEKTGDSTHGKEESQEKNYQNQEEKNRKKSR